MASFLDCNLKERIDIGLKDSTIASSLCIGIASEIEAGSMKLCTFVETLGSYVTDQHLFTREKGIAVLSSVLSQMSPNYLNESELHFITTFYSDRIKDHYDIIPSVLTGILAIVNMTHLPKNAPLSLLRAIFEHVQCQSQLLPERHNIYLIFKSLIENKLDDLKTMGSDLVYGIINSIDGERDPNNLMLLFTILPYFIREYPLGHLTEEMFEVMACYFPVDFNPSGLEELNVTRRDLAEKLSSCLCVIPEFTDYCIPLIIDKLYSTLRVAKLDSLNLLHQSIPIFGLPRIKPYALELWTTLRNEIMSGRDNEIRDSALEASRSLIKLISADEVDCQNYIDKIITDTKPSLRDVRLSLYRPAEDLLGKIASISKAICVQIIKSIIPICIGQYSTKTLFDDKIVLIETLNNFMNICSGFGFCIQDVPELSWINMPQLYLDGLAMENIELKGKIFLGLAIQKAYLNNVQRSLFYNAVFNEIETGCDEIQIICHATILDFASLYLEEILILIKERLLSNSDKVEIDLLKRRIMTLSAIAKKRELGRVILPKIVTILTDNANTDVCGTALLSIQQLIDVKELDFNIHQFLYKECHIIDKLIPYETGVANHRLLISNICQLIVRNLTTEEQRTIVNKYAVVLNRKIRETNVPVILNLLIPLRKDINLNISDNAIENLYKLAISSTNPDVRQTTCKFLSILLNKMGEEDLDWVVHYLEDRININLEADIDMELKLQTVYLQIWMTKALITRGYGRSQYFLETLTRLLNHSEVGQYVGQQYKLLVSKSEDILLMENFCNIKILYKQRVFGYLLQQNVTFINATRQNYLTALVYSLKQMPEKLLFLHISELVPLLIESLSLGNEHLVLWTLISLKLLLETKNDIFSDNIQCIVPRLLQLSTYPAMVVRIAALECLTHYANYSTILINPYKQIVLDKLRISIDDRKRLVRKAAVQARTRWFIVGASENAKD